MPRDCTRSFVLPRSGSRDAVRGRRGSRARCFFFQLLCRCPTEITMEGELLLSPIARMNRIEDGWMNAVVARGVKTSGG